jgi:DNA polymerase-3 subunit delta
MKVTGARIAGFLRQPDASCRAVLVYGPDTGLVRERGEALLRAIVPDPGDPFRVAELSGAALASDPARLADEISAQSLIGGRRAIRVRDASDAAAPIVVGALAASRGDGFVIVEAGDLPTRSALRKHFEGAADAAALPCYADTGRDLAEVIRTTFAPRRIAISADATAFLVDHLGSDRQVTRSELEKLALYVGDGGKIGLAEASECVGDSAALSVDDVVFAAAEGDAPALERALLRALQEGEAPIGILRAAMRYLQRLQLCLGRIRQGQSAEEAMRFLRPPLFFKVQDRFAGQLRRWTLARTGAALAALTEAELRAKQSIFPQETICRAALLDVSRRAAAKSARAPVQ